MANTIHLSTSDSKASIDKLEILLASTYALYLKTQNFHWNVQGQSFAMLHELFGEQYEELAEAIDEIAERIRMLGAKAPGSFEEYSKLSILKSATKSNDSKSMITELLADHSSIIKLLRDSISKIEKGDDQGTLDFCVGRLQAHEKAAWFLQSHIE